MKKNFNMEISFGGTGLVYKALFAKHLAIMLRSGLPINEALQVAAGSAKGKLKKVLFNVLTSVSAGHTLSASLALYPKIFSQSFISAVQAGESAGTLEGNLAHQAIQLEKEKELVSKIRGAMFYPLIVLAAAFILGLGMAFLVLPKITPLFEGLKMNLPFTTRALIWFSHFVQKHGVILFLGIILFVAFFVWLVRQKFSRPVTHWLLLKAPFMGRISRNANLARFARTLGMMLKSGLNIDEALDITQKTVGNYYYQKFLAKVSLSISKGSKLSDNLQLASGLFPIMIVSMVKVGEESGNLEETLLYLADFYDAEVDVATKSLSTIIEPLLLIVIGSVVGFLALSIITPIYNITGGMKR